MAQFDFQCAKCHHTMTIDGRAGDVPKTPYHHKRPMRRLYTPINSQVEWSRSDYVEKAYRGEETVPGMSTADVRDMVDNDFAKVS